MIRFCLVAFALAFLASDAQAFGRRLRSGGCVAGGVVRHNQPPVHFHQPVSHCQPNFAPVFYGHMQPQPTMMHGGGNMISGCSGGSCGAGGGRLFRR